MWEPWTEIDSRKINKNLKVCGLVDNIVSMLFPILDNCTIIMDGLIVGEGGNG